MASELAKKVSGLASAISFGGLSTRSSRRAYDELPDQPHDQSMPAHEVLAERALRSGKLVGAISSGGLSTRPSRKAYEEVKSPFEEPRKPSASPLQPMREDAEVISDANTCLRLKCCFQHSAFNTASDAHLKVGLLDQSQHFTLQRSACLHDALIRAKPRPMMVGIELQAAESWKVDTPLIIRSD